MGKKLKTKIIALFLAAFLTIPVLSGCEKKGDNLHGGGDISSQSEIIPTVFKIYVPKA